MGKSVFASENFIPAPFRFRANVWKQTAARRTGRLRLELLLLLLLKMKPCEGRRAAAAAGGVTVRRAGCCCCSCSCYCWRKPGGGDVLLLLLLLLKPLRGVGLRLADRRMGGIPEQRRRRSVCSRRRHCCSHSERISARTSANSRLSGSWPCALCENGKEANFVRRRCCSRYRSGRPPAVGVEFSGRRAPCEDRDKGCPASGKGRLPGRMSAARLKRFV